jgi:uncharacterized protein (TIGR00297 family)
MRWALGALLGSGVAGLAYWRHALTLDGAVVAAMVGSLVYIRGGMPAAGALLAFFASSSALSRLGHARKQSMPLAQAKGARRDAWQVLANGGTATLSIAIGQRHAFVGALAAAGADTWATELGLLAKGPPRLMTTLRTVPPGTSGGITPEGLAASLGGAIVVGMTYAALGRDARAIRASVVAGVCASLADSLLGATVQALYRCPKCDAVTEAPIHRRCGTPTKLVRGYRWMTNDTVNAIATVVGAAIGWGLGVEPDAAGHVRGGS